MRETPDDEIADLEDGTLDPDESDGAGVEPEGADDEL